MYASLSSISPRDSPDVAAEGAGDADRGRERDPDGGRGWKALTGSAGLNVDQA
jgi:hypothetical protein